MSVNQKKPLSREHYMVKCLFEETKEQFNKFTEWEEEFINSIYTKFFDDPELKLTSRQLEVLERLWAK